MQMRPQIQIDSAIKALKDVIIPAIDPANKLAVEQSQLIIGLLGLMARQLPLQFRFDRDELSRLSACAAQLATLNVSDGAARGALAALATANGQAEHVLEHCTVDPARLVEQVRLLREQIGAVVTGLAASDDTANQLKVERMVLAMSKEQLLRDRSLMKTQGWELDPAALPDIETLLGPA